MSTYDKVKELILEHLDVEEKDITMDADFLDDLGADSLDVAELVMAIEETFNFEIDDEKIEDMKTVKDVVTYLDSL